MLQSLGGHRSMLCLLSLCMSWNIVQLSYGSVQEAEKSMSEIFRTLAEDVSF